MAFPDAQSIMLPLLELAGENHIRQVRDAVNRMAVRNPSAFARCERLPSLPQHAAAASPSRWRWRIRFACV